MRNVQATKDSNHDMLSEYHRPQGKHKILMKGLALHKDLGIRISIRN